jgi:hypothetical protein
MRERAENQLGPSRMRNVARIGRLRRSSGAKEDGRAFRDFLLKQNALALVVGVMVGARLFQPFARGRMYVAPEIGFAPRMATVAARRSAVRTLVRQRLSEPVKSVERELTVVGGSRFVRGRLTPCACAGAPTPLPLAFAQDASGRSSSVGMTVGSRDQQAEEMASPLTSGVLLARGRIRPMGVIRFGGQLI